MNIGIHNVYPVFNQNNNVFNPECYGIGDDLACGAIVLKSKLADLSHSLNTLDLIPDNKLDKIIFMDYPTGCDDQLKMLHDQGIELYLILYENPMIKPDNYDPMKHIYFKKVFTWWQYLLCGGFERYVKIYLPISTKIVGHRGFNRKTSCMISSNKDSEHPNSKYYVRKNVIQFYCDNPEYREHFDLFGQGWDINNPVYRGAVKSKWQLMNNYKFAFAMENAEYRGYVTEKPFDAMKSLTVPIYFKNPELPKEVYLDFNQFGTLKELHKYISKFAGRSLLKYQENIIAYLMSNHLVYSADNFAETIVKYILGEDNG